MILWIRSCSPTVFKGADSELNRASPWELPHSPPGSYQCVDDTTQRTVTPKG